jgi:hypothetical protein
MPTKTKKVAVKKETVFIVIIGQGWKYRMPTVFQRIGARVTRGWLYTDDSSTEVSFRVLWNGTADTLQQALWNDELSSCSVYVRAAEKGVY